MYLATRVKKTRRTRKSTAPAAAEAGVDAVAVRREDATVEATDGALSPAVAAEAPVAGAALDIPVAPARGVRRSRKQPAAAHGQDGVGPALPAGELSTELSAAAPDAPFTAPGAPARRTRRTRKAAEGEEDALPVAVAPVGEPPAGDGARKRGRRSTSAARPVGEAAEAPVRPVAPEPASTAAATPEADAPPRLRARRRKSDVAVPGIEPAGGN
jgi:hypothetical protein